MHLTRRHNAGIRWPFGRRQGRGMTGLASLVFSRMQHFLPGIVDRGNLVSENREHDKREDQRNQDTLDTETRSVVGVLG